MMIKNMGITGIATLMIALVICTLPYNTADANVVAGEAQKEAPKTNYVAPSFELPSLDGKSYRVGGHRDKLLLINFWASWCEPCHMEASELQSVYTTYQDQLDLYAVNATFMDSRAGAVDFVTEYELTFPTLLDTNGEVTRSKYWIDGYPTSFLINHSGVIVETYFGTITKAELDRDIKKWLQTSNTAK